MVSKTGSYLRSYDGQTKWMYFLSEGGDLFEKYNTIWNKFSNDIKNSFTVSLYIIHTF